MTFIKFENVQNYPRPPVLEPVRQSIRVEFGGKTIVESDNTFRVLETHHAPTYYIPEDAINAVMIPAAGQSYCEWKGVATYWDIQSGAVKATKAAWSYAAPTKSFEQIKGYIAFYAGLMDACFVGEHQVMPQSGDFYGGWVTENLKGQIKGAPGTEFW